MSVLWIDGALVDKSSAWVSPFDHGFLYGDGVWEPLRIFNGRLFRLHEHLDNLYHSCERQGIVIPQSREQLATAIEATVRANGRTEGYVRVIVSRGAGTLGPDPRKLDPRVIIIAEEYRPFPAELVEHGLYAVTFSASQWDCRLLGRPEIVAAKRHAIENGCLEAILVDGTGEVHGTTEGTLFAVKDGEVIAARGRLPDAEVDALVTLAREMGLSVAELGVSLGDLASMSELFVVGTSCGVVGIVRVDGADIGHSKPGPMTLQLRTQFHALQIGFG